MTALYTAAVAVFEQAIRDWPIPEVALKSGKVSPELLAAVRDLGNVLGECGFDLDQVMPVGKGQEPAHNVVHDGPRGYTYGWFDDAPYWEFWSGGGNLIGQYDTWAEALVDFPELADQ